MPVLSRANLALTAALLALVASTGGTAYAAGQVAAKNSVVSKSIRNGQVKTHDLRDGAVSSAKIADGTITAQDLAAGTLPELRIKPGSIGANALGTTVLVEAMSGPVGDGDGTTNGGDVGIADVNVTCPGSSQLLSGGALWTGTNASNEDESYYLQSSHLYGNGWRARGVVDWGAQGTIRLRVFALCLSAEQPAGGLS